MVKKKKILKCRYCTSFYTYRNWGSRSLYNLPKVTKLEFGEEGASIQAFPTLKPTYFTLPRHIIQKYTRRQQAIILLVRDIQERTQIIREYTRLDIFKLSVQYEIIILKLSSFLPCITETI